MDIEAQINAIRKTGLVHSTWYRKTYKDVAILGMDPAEHYLKYGARLGRDPGRSFDTRFYLDEYPDVIESGMNPLLHYALFGKAEGRARTGSDRKAPREARHRIETLKGKLQSLGFEDQPLVDFQELLETGSEPEMRARAARELALWRMREKTEEGYRAALALFDRARREKTEEDLQRRLGTAQVLCHFFLGDRAGGMAAFERLEQAGLLCPDTYLAHANLQEGWEARLSQVNRCLAAYGIAPVALRPGEEKPAYDRLCARTPLPPVPATEGPKVTVLVAAYDAADTIPTTLRSLQEQTWKNLEILVIDDCSPDNTRAVVAAAAADDPRIRLIEMDRNGGAYVARNRGLDLASGTYVTLHDADDWSHPVKIETQVRFMEDNPAVIGCTSEQARATSELEFARWTGDGRFIITNTSSFMFRRAPMREKLGYWDTVRFSADNELIRRMRTVFGKDAVRFLNTGPLSFQRDSETSIIADDVLGVNGFLFGARKEYLDAQTHLHRSGKSLKYGNDIKARPFPVPVIMRPDRKELLAKPRHLPVILGSEFRMPGGSLQSCLEEMRFCRDRGIPMGIFEMYWYDLDTGRNLRKHMLDEVREMIDGEAIQLLAYGEEVSCDLLLLRYPPILHHRQRYIPTIDAKSVKVIVNQPPMSDYSDQGVRRYSLARCAENLRHYFHKDATWHPIGPLVREALTTHHAGELDQIALSDTDWHNIIDVDAWDRGPRTRGPNDRLRIGRHSRNHPMKWPATRQDLLAAYPDAEDVEVHVLGGADAPIETLGYKPANWVVHPFGAMGPRDFLTEIDVYVYFTHPDWVESFGRSIVEAMAAGVPVILPPSYKPLFGEAALYALPGDVLTTARRLHADPDRYRSQADLAKTYVRQHFGHDMHGDRLKAEGVALD